MIISWIFCLYCFFRLVVNFNFLDAIFQLNLVAYAMLLIFTWISFFFSRSQIALLCVPESNIQWSHFTTIVLKFPQFEQKNGLVTRWCHLSHLITHPPRSLSSSNSFSAGRSSARGSLCSQTCKIHFHFSVLSRSWNSLLLSQFVVYITIHFLNSSWS